MYYSCIIRQFASAAKIAVFAAIFFSCSYVTIFFYYLLRCLNEHRFLTKSYISHRNALTNAFILGFIMTMTVKNRKKDT